MSLQQRDHDTAVGWINVELEELARTLGKPNASAAATSAITLAFMLRVIDESEQRAFRARVDDIYASYNESHSTAA